ncbi:MAG TPA: hypothetical protein VMU89_05455, partial [Thermomicrobiaceae bacterium]|nr:hypothetical protein [Thermomicrobiaceae bacterium]
MGEMVPTSYRGVTFASLGITIILQGPLGDLSLDGNYIAGGEESPVFAGVVPKPRLLPCEVWFNPTNWEHDRDVFLGLVRFDLTGADAMGALVLTREDGTDVTIQARPKTLATKDVIDATYSFAFECAETDWKAVTATTSTTTGPAVAGNPVSTALALGGTARTRPRVTLAPQKAKTSGATYSSVYTIAELDNLTCYNIPQLITFNHAALVTAGESTAGGTDILVSVNGQQVPRTVVGPNTTTCRVVYQVPQLLAGDTNTVVISYAPSGQTYGLGGYAQDYVTSIVTERSSNLLTTYPYSITFNHAAIVTAGRSQASGADIRVIVNGIEVPRVFNGVNTATCQVFFSLAIGAGSRAAVSILTSASGYNYALSAYTNGSMDLTKSTNTQWIYTTPNNDGAGNTVPGQTGLVAMQVVGSFALNALMAHVTGTIGTDPSYNIIEQYGGSGDTNNYLRFFAGGVHILSIAYECQYQTPVDSGGVNMATAARVASTTQNAMTAGWTNEQAYQNTALTLAAYATKTLQSGACAVALGIERTTSNSMISNGISHWAGSGATELLLNLDSTLVPATASQTSPTLTSVSSGFNYPLAGQLADGTRTLTISSLALSQGQSLVIDAPTHTAWLTDSVG